MFTFTTDSAVDVFVGELKEKGIPCVPLTYTVNGEVFEDIAENDESFKQFYADIKKGALPVTSQINPFTHEEFWESVYGEHKQDIVHLCLSGGLSETYRSACKAADEFNAKHDDAKVYVVDSLGATQAEAPVYEKAIEFRDAGMGAAEAAEKLREYAKSIQVYIIADDLFHLKRGGRVSAAAAVVGSLFNIKPIIVFNEQGQLCVYKKPAGWKKALKTVLEHIEKYAVNKGGKIWIAHADALDKAEVAKAAIEEKFGMNAKIGWIGRVVGAHTGLGTIGLVFEAEKRLDIKH